MMIQVELYLIQNNNTSTTKIKSVTAALAFKIGRSTSFLLTRIFVKIQYCLRGRGVVSSTSDRKGSIFKWCVLRTGQSDSRQHPQDVNIKNIIFGVI